MKRDLYDEARRFVGARDIAHAHGVGPKDVPRGISRVDPSSIPDWFKPLTAASHVAMAVTYEWKCRICGESTYVGAEGGELETCDCDHSQHTGLDVFLILNGKRTFQSRVEDIGKPTTGKEAA